MDTFINILKKHDFKNSDCLSRNGVTTLQVNMGNLCNQNCFHCHVEASPKGEKIMSKDVINDILSFLSRHKIHTLDITGGAPEMNPHFQYFVKKARILAEELIVRTNLTILTENSKKDFPFFYKENNVHLICSMPCYLEKNVDSQRGNKVFKKSIEALKILNKAGYAKNNKTILDLVYNPVGPNLPPNQKELEKNYKKVLRDEYGIKFDKLITITNVAIKRFRNYLEDRGEYAEYQKLLKNNFNPDVLESIMCKTFLSVGFDGKLYDCDFNQALGLKLTNKDGSILNIKNLNPDDLIGRDIILGEHCLSCTAGSGSSCRGALSTEKIRESSSNTLSVKKKKEEDITEEVKSYYGKILATKNDLKTSACCTSDAMPIRHQEILKEIEPEIINKFYGCGSPIPHAIEEKTILDLGCGTGRDVYIASKLVGEEGKVIGVDMTDEQLNVAQLHRAKQAKTFGYSNSNVKFIKGYIENLEEAGIEDNSVDVIMSNCVINLSINKNKVFKEIFRVLKEGGELYFSDVFADRRIPEKIKNDPIFYGECLGGALYIEDFRRILHQIGCPDYRIVSCRKINLNNQKMLEKASNINFYSMTVRAFKLSILEDICEDYGQVATYLGTIKDNKQSFTLDDHHIFITNKPMLVCGNTAAMLEKTRYSPHFKIYGNRNQHYGKFNCAQPASLLQLDESMGGCC